MIECPNCGRLNSDDNKFCGTCGTKLPAPEIYCPKCERRYDGENFCTQCGTKLVNEKEYLEEVERLKQEEEKRKYREKIRQEKLLKYKEEQKLREKRRQEKLLKQEEERKLREKRKQEELLKQEEERKNKLFKSLCQRMGEETISIASRCLEMSSSNKKEVIVALIDKFNTEEEIYKAIRGQKRKEGHYSSEPSFKWVTCPNCNHAVNAAAINCPYCTHKLRDSVKSSSNKANKYSSNKIQCSKCGNLYNKFKYKSCPNCGEVNPYRKI